jgi:hypothetical protein
MSVAYSLSLAQGPKVTGQFSGLVCEKQTL